MKKGYYIHFQGRESIGVSKKIDMQIKEFSKHYNMSELEIKAVDRTLLQRIFGLFPTASIARDYDEALKKLETLILYMCAARLRTERMFRFGKK